MERVCNIKYRSGIFNFWPSLLAEYAVSFIIRREIDSRRERGLKSGAPTSLSRPPHAIEQKNNTDVLRSQITVMVILSNYLFRQGVRRIY
jgi:hypothetical protein